MATPSGSAYLLRKLRTNLLREREVSPRALLLAQEASDVVSGGAAVIYLLEKGEPGGWLAKAVVGEIHLESDLVPLDSATLAGVLQDRKPTLFQGSQLVREDYAHLHATRTLISLVSLPILADDEVLGALQVASFGEVIEEEHADLLQELAEEGGIGLASALQYEQERNSHLESISRLAQLYDLEKVFNSTLEMNTLLPIVASKFREVLEVQAVNLWMVKDENELTLMSQVGADPTTEEGGSQRRGEGLVADVSDSGEPKFIDDPTDPYLLRRNEGIEDGQIFSLMAAPMVVNEQQVGVVEAINKSDGSAFGDDDLFFLVSLAETAAAALHNASLLQAERKVEILQILVKVSTEITSTLNLDRVLQAIVNTPSAVIGYDRAAIALEQRGRQQLKAISGTEEVHTGDPEIEHLQELIEWAALLNEPVLVTEKGGEIQPDREATRAKFRRYFSSSDMKAFYAVPLGDDEGRVGTLSFESSNPDFLSEAHREMIQVLAGQATVALRNASLYKEVPFIGVLEPFLQKKQRFLALEKRRRALLMAVAAAAVLFLVAVPIPMRVEGTAAVGPARTAQVQAQVDGVINKVYVSEGEEVQRGEVLADLEDWNYRTELAAAQAKYGTALSQMNRALAANDGTEAGIQRAQAAYWQSEVERARDKLDRTHLRAPFDGWVTTPRVQDLAGRSLKAGDLFAEIVDRSQAMVDVAIEEQDAPLLRTGTAAAVKLESFPLRTFHGSVAVVSPKAQVFGDDRFFFARVAVPNRNGELRSGMQGRGKISVAWRPVGYVLFRRPAMWVFQKLWSWFGW